jgi:nucleoside-diphosphate-sugar epimerase
MQIKKVMILGANGFLGRNLVNLLDDGSYDLTLIDRHVQMPDDSVKDAWINNRLVYQIDLNEDLHYVKEKLKDIDIVVHLANRARIDPSWNEFEDYYRTNIGTTQKLYKLCHTMKVKKFIYVSSSSVYGNNGSDIQKETDTLCPTNPYALSKMAAEMALKIQQQKGGPELVIVRPFTMYGDYMDFGPDALVIAKFISALEKGEPLMLHGGGSQSRDFLHVQDAARGMKLIIDRAVSGCYNLGRGKSITIKQLADTVSPRQIIAPDRIGAVHRTCADISKLQGLGFDPKIDVIEWLQDLVAELNIKEIII